MIRRSATLFLLFMLSACVFAATEPQTLPPTATTVNRLPTTLVPTLDRQAQAIARSHAAEPIGNPDCAPETEDGLTRHTVTANLNYTRRAVVVEQTSIYTNRTRSALQMVVMNVEANQWPDAFALNQVRVGSVDAAYELTGRRLEISLQDPLEYGCSVTVRLSFLLTVPRIGDGILAYKGYLGYSPRQLNLSNWLPVFAPRMSDEWVTRQAVIVGEQTVLEAADWDVTLNISGEAAVLERLIVVGPGDVEQNGERTWHFRLQRARDFTISMSDAFDVRRTQAQPGVMVEVYTFADAQVQSEGGAVDGAAYALELAAQSLELYSRRFGPYPYSRLAVVEGDFPDGMEFTGVVFVSGDWFRRFVGSPQSYLMIITVHEIAHQWWYASVGSDQALTPWLDEALATYSEYLFIETYYPELKDWWWSFRVDNYAPQGFVDSTVYEFDSIRAYINAVYLLGARMLHDLRADLGDEAFFDLLRLYVETGRYQIATPALFWSLLTPEQMNATQSTRQRYFRVPGIAQG